MLTKGRTVMGVPPQKLHLPIGGSGPTWVCIPNSTLIGSSIFVGCMFVCPTDKDTHTQTNRHTNHATYVARGHNLCTLCTWHGLTTTVRVLPSNRRAHTYMSPLNTLTFEKKDKCSTVNEWVDLYSTLSLRTPNALDALVSHKEVCFK